MKKYRLTAAVLAVLLCALVPLTGCDKKGNTDDTEKVSDTRYDYDLSDYVKVDFYKGIKVPAYDTTITDEDVQQQVLLARSSFATVAEKQDPIINSDQVNIDYVGYMNGEEFAGGSATGADLTIGSGQFIDGFEEGLVGAKVGDTVTLDLHFPDPYQNMPSYAGAAVQFVVTINKVYTQVLPAYTDEFVKENFGYDTVALFEAAILESLAERAESMRFSYMVETIWGELLEKTEFVEYPQTEFDMIYEEYIRYYTDEAEAENMTLNEYVMQNGMLIADFEDAVESLVRESMQQEMLLYYIARNENLTVTEEEYIAGAADYAAYYNLSSAEQLEQYLTKDEIAQMLLFEEVNLFLVENAITE